MGCGSSRSTASAPGTAKVVERDAEIVKGNNSGGAANTGGSYSCPSSPEHAQENRLRSASMPGRSMSMRSIGRKSMFSEKRTNSILMIRNEGYVLQPEFEQDNNIPEGPLDLSTKATQVRVPTQDLNDMKTGKFQASHVDLSELTWDLDLFSKSSDWTVEAALAMYKATDVLEKFGISEERLLQFILTVRCNYRDNAFHNWWHAFSVMHAAWMMVCDASLRPLLSDIEVLGVVLAALCHDLDHPGVNNDFLAKTSHPLAGLYDKPILENHHWAMTRKILTESTDVLDAVPKAECAELLDVVHMAIMATDMGCHKALCENIAAKAVPAEQRGGGQGSNTLQRERREDRMLLVEVVVHAADLSAQGMAPPVAYKFGGNVLTEFHEQFLLEHEKRVPLSAFMKDLHTPLGQCKAQLSFIDFVLIPLFSTVRDCFPSLGSPACRIEDRMAEIDFEQAHLWPGRVPELEAQVPPETEP